MDTSVTLLPPKLNHSVLLDVRESLYAESTRSLQSPRANISQLVNCLGNHRSTFLSSHFLTMTIPSELDEGIDFSDIEEK